MKQPKNSTYLFATTHGDMDCVVYYSPQTNAFYLCDSRFYEVYLVVSNEWLALNYTSAETWQKRAYDCALANGSIDSNGKCKQTVFTKPVEIVSDSDLSTIVNNVTTFEECHDAKRLVARRQTLALAAYDLRSINLCFRLRADLELAKARIRRSQYPDYEITSTKDSNYKTAHKIAVTQGLI